MYSMFKTVLMETLWEQTRNKGKCRQIVRILLFADPLCSNQKECKRKMKRLTSLCIVIVLILGVLSAGCATNNPPQVNSELSEIEITDDDGNLIKMDKPAQRIISLYSAHTINLFSLGLEEEIIGVGKSDNYPPQVRKKEVFDYKSDPEKVIAASPDLVLIRPFITRSNPEFVEALKKANITVVSLYPESFAEFVTYIEKLAVVTGQEEKAQSLLDTFTNDIHEIQEITSEIEPKVRVYFESTENQYRTITPDSTPAQIIKYAGGINIATDAKGIRPGTSIASYGAERILEKAEEIDIFVAQRGAMNAGGSPHSIKIRPGFHAIKAVREDRIYNIEEKLVSSPTFRLAVGVKELARMFYPEVMDDVSKFANKEVVTRAQMAQMVVMFKHKGIFVPSSKYYKKSHRGHVYGDFTDVAFTDPAFEYIESAVLSGYMEGEEDKFYPQTNITREELASVLYMLADLEDKAGEITISDQKECSNQRQVEIILENGIMSLEDGHFKPKDAVTGEEVVECLMKLEAYQ